MTFGVRVSYATNMFFPLAEQDMGWHITTASACSKWILIPGLIAVGFMIYYLYSAQRQIASARIVKWLTAIRMALIALLAVLLLRPLWTWSETHKAGETLWVV